MKLDVRTLAGLAIAIALAPAAHAEDWKWDPKGMKGKPKVGDKYTEEGDIYQKQKSVVSVDKQVVQQEDKEEKASFKSHHEVKAVDKDKVTEEVIRVEKWAQTRKGEEGEDKSLEGQTILVTTKDGKKTYTLPDDKDGKVSEGAKHFIEETYCKKKKKKGDDGEEKDDDDDEEMKALFPATPVADNGEWTADPAVLTKKLFESADSLDLEKSSVKGKLTGVKVKDGVHVGKIEVKAKLQLKQLPGTPMEIAWTEGGAFEITMVMEGSLEFDKAEFGIMQVEAGLKGKADFDANGQKANLKMNVENKIKRTRTNK